MVVVLLLSLLEMPWELIILYPESRISWTLNLDIQWGPLYSWKWKPNPLIKVIPAGYINLGVWKGIKIIRKSAQDKD